MSLPRLFQVVGINSWHRLFTSELIIGVDAVALASRTLCDGDYCGETGLAGLLEHRIDGAVLFIRGLPPFGIVEAQRLVGDVIGCSCSVLD